MSTLRATLRDLLMNIIAAISRARHPSSSSGTPPVQPPYMARLTTTGDTTAIATHSTIPYTVTAYDQFGILFLGAPGPYTWHSATPAKATIDAISGVATGVAAGTSAITVSAVNSLGSTITSDPPVTLTVSAQVATSPIAVSPPSVSLAAGTQQFTAVVSDQATVPNVISGASVTWDTDNHAVATVNGSGLLTVVGNGTCTLTATSGGATGTASVAVSASSVTSVSILYNSVTATQLLMRTGTAYTFVAKDQAGNTLSNVGTWNAVDSTNFPINSTSGIITPITAAAGQGTTFTYTHTTTQHTATCTATALLPTTPLVSDVATNYTGDTGSTGFMNAINHYVYDNSPSSAVNISYNSNIPTGPYPASKYIDGSKVNQITWDNSAARQFMGNPVLNVAIPQGGGGSTLLAPFAPAYGTGYARLWCMVVKRYDPGFTTVGAGGSAAAAYKDTPWFAWQPGVDGRSGIEYTNTTGIDLGCGIGSSSVTAGSSTRTIGNGVGAAWSNGLWYVDFALYEIRSGRVMSARAWRSLLGDDIASWMTNNSASGSANGLVEGPPANLNSNAPLSYTIQPFGANYNRGVPAPGYNKQVALWEVVNGTTYGDPYGILGTQPTPVLSGISGGTVTQGDVQKVITLTGTGFNDNCYPIFSNANVKPSWLGDGITPIARTGSTQFAVTVDIPASAPSDVGTVAIYNAGSQVTSATQVVTIGTLAAPGAPTASNATTVNNQTVTFPVTLNAFGDLPDRLAWQYSTDNVSFTSGADLPLTSPSLGQVVNQQVALPNPSTLYYVKVAEKNSAGTSSFATSVTGTTGAAGGLPTSGLVLDFNADLGLDVSTDGAAVGSWLDQSATGTQWFQATTSKKPILRTNKYGTHAALEFVAANSANITSNTAVSALNTADCTIIVVGENSQSSPVNDGRWLANLDTGNKQGYLLKMVRTTTTVAVQIGSGSAFPLINLSTTMSPGTLHAFGCAINHTTPTQVTTYDGTAVSAGSNAYSAPVAAPPLPSIGSSTGSSNFLDGFVTRVFQWNRALSGAELAQVYSYLKAQGYPLP